jgi:hypothetical protein
MHVTVVVMKINVGYTKECISAAHAPVVLHLKMLSRIQMRSVMTLHIMMAANCV